MYFVFEISNPIQIKPYIYRSHTTRIRVVWFWFAFSIHPGRYDEMIERALESGRQER